jgi:hypothetical protein
MNDEEMEDTSSGLDVLRSSLSSAVRRGGPLSSVIERSLEKAGVPKSIEVDYEPMPETQEEARLRAPPSRTPFRDRFIAELDQTMQKLLAPKPEPKTLLDVLYRKFAMPTGKSGSLIVAQQERAEKEAEDEMTRRETILEILGKQAEMERQQELNLAAQRRAAAEASKGKGLQSGGGRRYVFKDPEAAGVKAKRASQVFDPDLGPGYMNDQGEFIPENLAPEGTRVITSSVENPESRKQFNDRILAFNDEKRGLIKLNKYFKDLEDMGQSGFDTFVNKITGNVKKFFGTERSREEFATQTAEARQQALIGALRLDVLGPGVVTKEDAQRLEKAVGGNISILFSPETAKYLLRDFYEDKSLRAKTLSEFLQDQAEFFDQDPSKFALDVPETLGGDTLRGRRPRGGKPPAGGARPPAAGGVSVTSTPPQGAIDKLKANPNLAAAFDEKYGAGASRKYLGK